jgi:hypothetical protein
VLIARLRSGIGGSGVWLGRLGRGAACVSFKVGGFRGGTRKTEDFARLKDEIMTSG